VLNRAIVGWATLAIGAALVATSYRERRVVPPWVPQVAIAVVALGISTLAASRFGVVWSVTSIAFSLVAIVLLIRVILSTLRRRR
jgi:uncharacterized membrane-anchored protein